MSGRKAPQNAIFDFNIDIKGMLDRPRVNQCFAKGLECPLTVVYAPSGYGKTTAALQFAKNVNARIVYMALNELDKNPRFFWSHLTGLFCKILPDLGLSMSLLDFPGVNGHMMQLADLLKSYAQNRKLILMIDDFQVAECPEIEGLIARIANLKLMNLHIIIISRILPKICSMDMKVKGLLKEITKEDLRLDIKELMAYYRLHGVIIGTEDANKIDKYTEGWASAVYLSFLYFRQNPEDFFRIAVFNIDRLIENTVYSNYDSEIREFLMKLSILDQFDIEICTYLTGCSNAYSLLSRVLGNNSFLKISEDRQFFKMHCQFRDFLQRKLLEQSGINKRELQIKAGEYYEYKNDILMALMHYDLAEEYDRITMLVLKNKCSTSFTNDELMSITQYIDRIPVTYFDKYPMLHLISAMSFTRTKQVAKSIESIAQVEKQCTDPMMPPETRNKLLGEAALVKALLSFNDTSKMMHFFEEASILLPQGTELVGVNWSYTFGSPSVLYLYYNQAGHLDEMLNNFSRGFPYWASLTDLGCGANFQLKAEAAFERCDLETAEQDAYRALYRAEQKQQNSVIIAARLLIIKICAAKGKYNNAEVLLSEMREQMNYRKARIYLSTLDMCAAYFNLLSGHFSEIPKWLQNGEVEASAVNRAGYGMEWLIYAQVLMHRQEYIKLEQIITVMLEVYGLFRNQYGIIRANLAAAVASFHLYGAEKAVDYLQKAFKIAKADRLVMPYLELGEHLLPVLQHMLRTGEGITGELDVKALENIVRHIKDYQKALARFRRGFYIAHPEKQEERALMTKREMEVLTLIAQGLSGEEIARQLYVTPINIRKITSMIYGKLGVNSRVDAVRAAIDSGLVK